MRRSTLQLFMSLLTASIALGQPDSVGRSRPEAISRQDSRLVAVLSRGLLFHRHDHLTVAGTLQITPEEAKSRGYVRCPECLPPETTVALNDETTGPTRLLSEYYKTYLKDRANPGVFSLPSGAQGEPEGGVEGRMSGSPVAAPKVLTR